MATVHSGITVEALDGVRPGQCRALALRLHQTLSAGIPQALRALTVSAARMVHQTVAKILLTSVQSCSRTKWGSRQRWSLALGISHCPAMCSSIGSLLDGRSRLHLKPDGSLIQPPPTASAIEDAVVALAVQVTKQPSHPPFFSSVRRYTCVSSLPCFFHLAMAISPARCSHNPEMGTIACISFLTGQ